MANYTPTTPTIAGIAPASNAAAAGDAVLNAKGTTLLRVNNASGGSINLTLAAQQTTRAADGTFPAMTLANQVIAVPAGASRLIGPINPAFNDGNGYVQMSWSATASVTWESYFPNA